MIKVGTEVYVMIIKDSLTTNYKGVISSIAAQTIPAPNIRKGDYWIDVEKLNKIILGKKDCLMRYGETPLFVFGRVSE